MMKHNDMVSKLAMVFAVVFLLIGVLGFIPGITNNGLLLGIFQVGPLHNIVHLITGGAALWAAKSGMGASKMFFKVFGVIYAIVTVLGLVSGYALGVAVPVNGADNVLHIVVAVVALYAGFGMKAGHKMMDKPDLHSNQPTSPSAGV